MKFNVINMNGLYKSEPFDIRGNDPYWCKNWTFKVKEIHGTLYMVDTYFNDRYIEVTNDNVNNFKFVFDFNEVKEINESEYEKYNDEDRFMVAIGSGGIQYGTKYFVKNNAEYSKDKLIEIVKYEIKELESEIKYNKSYLQVKKEELSKLISD